MRTDRRLLLAATAGAPFLAGARSTPASGPTASNTVSFRYDYAPVSAAAAVARLAQLAAGDEVEDQYLRGGAVRRLETRVAALFGKADAVFLPTGTMANSIALRVLCGERSRVLVQGDSHVYLDEGDACSVLGATAMIPMDTLQDGPDPEAVARLIADARTGPYPTPVGAISLESPVRRRSGAAIPFERLESIGRIAQKEGVRMHWDGARALMLLGTPGFDLGATAGLFETVYLSLYKYLGAPYGAVLAGPSAVVEKARELRHIYGGACYQAWQAALPALDALSTFETDIVAARGAFERVLGGLAAAGGFTIEPVPNGSNIVYVRLSPDRERGLVERLARAGVQVLAPEAGRLKMTLNLSVLRRPPRQIVSAFAGA